MKSKNTQDTIRLVVCVYFFLFHFFPLKAQGHIWSSWCVFFFIPKKKMKFFQQHSFFFNKIWSRTNVIQPTNYILQIIRRNNSIIIFAFNFWPFGIGIGIETIRKRKDSKWLKCFAMHYEIRKYKHYIFLQNKSMRRGTKREKKANHIVFIVSADVSIIEIFVYCIQLWVYRWLFVSQA